MKKKIMIVDDAESMIVLTKIALDDPGWEIKTALKRSGKKNRTLFCLT